MSNFKFSAWFIFCNLNVFCTAQVWQQVNFQSMLQEQFYITDGILFNDTGIVITSKGHIITSPDFYTSFKFDSIYHGAALRSISFAGRLNGFIHTGDVPGGIIKTIDGGLTWQTQANGRLGQNWGVSALYLNKDTALSANIDGGSLFLTHTGGQIWQEVNMDTVGFYCQRSFKLDFRNLAVGYMLGNTAFDHGVSGALRVYKTINGGLNWLEVSTLPFPTYHGYGDFVFLDDTTVILASSKVILKSVDGGYSFSPVMISNSMEDAMDEYRKAIAFVSHDTGYIAFASTVYKTYDAGNTWIKTSFVFDSVDINNEIQFIKAASGNKIIIGCLNGNIYKTETGGGVWADVKDAKSENTFSFYPNPTHDKLNCSVTNAALNSTIQISAVEGRVVLTGMPVTQPNFEIDVSPLPAGIYFLQLSDEKQRVVKKFVKQ